MIKIYSVVAATVFAASMGVTNIAPASAQLARPQTIIDASATSDLVTSVQYRRRGSSRGSREAEIGLGILGGAILGGIIASQSRPYYSGPGYYPAPGYYGPAPGYYGPGPGYYGPARGYDPGRLE